MIFSGKGHADLSWNWNQHTWSWRPDRGKWQPDFGFPKETVRLDVSTAFHPPADRLAFWSNYAFLGRDVVDEAQGSNPQGSNQGSNQGAVRTGAGADTFSARSRSIFDPGGAFFAYRATACAGRARPGVSRDGDISFGLILKGERRDIHIDGTETVTQAGNFFVYDRREVVRFRWTDHKAVSVTMSTERPTAVLGHEWPSSQAMAQALNGSRLAPLLRGQMLLLARQSGRMSVSEQSAVLHSLFDLILTILGQIPSTDGAAETRPRLDMLRQSTLRYIDQNIAMPHLDVMHIARVLGCSRATIYRAFADHDGAVADTIRRARLQRARQLLIEVPGMTVASVAARCGVSDIRTFNRMFRKFYGVTPREMQRGATGPAPIVPDRAAGRPGPSHQAE